jgi:HEAT repeat protein
MPTLPTITGREPRLSTTFGEKGQRRLSIMGLANSLNLLPANAISLTAFAEALRSDAFFVRLSAAKKLAERADREARLMMAKMLTEEPAAPTRASIARHLYGFSWFSAEPLIQQAFKDSDVRVREAAAYALCDFHELAAYQLLAAKLQNEADEVRMAAAWGLRDCQDIAALPCLEAVLKADDPEVRIKGLEALGGTELDEAMPVVRAMLNDAEPDVKYAATLSLIELAGDNCFQELSGMIGRTKGETLKQVLRGFFHATNYLKIDIGTAKASELLIDALEIALFDTSPEVRMAAIWPLAWTKHGRAPGILRRAYVQEMDAEVKAHILRVVVNLNEEVGVPMLEDALTSRELLVRAMADRLQMERMAVNNG